MASGLIFGYTSTVRRSQCGVCHRPKSGLTYQEMIRQYRAQPQNGQLREDAINELQLRERAGTSPVDLVTELRQVGPVAIQKWAYQFRLIKPVAVPHSVVGRLSIRHLVTADLLPFACSTSARWRRPE